DRQGAPRPSPEAPEADVSLVAGPASGSEAVFELSPAQERLWFVAQMLPGNPLYNVTLGYRVGSALDWALLQRCLAAIAERHEPLRTLFPERDGRARAIVSPETANAAVRLAHVDLGGEPPDAARAKLAELAAEHVT